MPSNLSEMYENWISRGEYKKALDFLKMNSHLDASRTLYFELKNFQNPSDSKEIAEKYFKENKRKITFQLNSKISSMTLPTERIRRRTLAQYFNRHFENKN